MFCVIKVGLVHTSDATTVAYAGNVHRDKIYMRIGGGEETLIGIILFLFFDDG